MIFRVPLEICGIFILGLQVAAAQQLKILTPSTLPTAAQSAPYSTTLTARGGTEPYGWTISSGALPSGLVLGLATGIISGIPVQAGNFSFTGRVVDAKLRTDDQSFQLAVDPPLVVSTAALPDASLGVAYSQALSASGGVAPYTWSIASGALPAGLSLASNGAIAGTPTSPGLATFRVRVADSGPQTATADLTINVRAPALSVGTASLPDATVGAGYSQTLAASGGVAPYTWSLTSGALPAGLSLAPNGAITGTPTTPGASTFRARVTDSASQTATADLTINVRAPALSVGTSSLPDATAGAAYSQTLAASGGISPYTWAIVSGSLPAGLSLGANGAITGTPTAVGSSTFRVRVTDSASQTATADLTINVRAPALSVGTSSLPDATVGAAYSQTLAASGGVGPYTWAIVSGSLPAGLSLGANGAITGTPTAVGSSTFRVRVTDSASQTATADLTINVRPPGLALTTTSLPDATVGAAYSQTLSASGGVGPYTWAIASGSLPAGLSLGSNGAITGTPTAVGTSTFQARVTDSASQTATANLTINVRPPGLSLSTTALPDATVGAAYSQTLSASGGVAPYAWSIGSGSLPAGLSLGANGAITGTPTAIGSSTFQARVTDSASQTATADLTINVRPPGLAVTTASLPDATTGSAYSQTLSVSGGVAPYFWSISGGSLPPGLNLQSGGSLTGVPTTSGTYTFTATVRDAAGGSASHDYTVRVAAGLAVTTGGLAGGVTGTAYSQTLSAAGGTPPYTFSLASGTLPPGIALRSDGTLSGTPTSAGNYPFTIRVSDASGVSVTRDLAIQVTAGLAITTTAVPDTVAGSPLSQTLAAAGGTPPYSWTVTSGALPPGVTLGAGTGKLAGTPTATGKFSFGIRVTDAAGATADRNFSVNVTGGLIISSAPVLPGGSVGVVYNYSLSAAGGQAPYRWAVSAGSLPAGLVLDAVSGTLSGTVSAAGSWDFTVQVTDAAGATGTKQFSLTTATGLMIATGPQLPDAAIGVAYQQRLSLAGGRPPYALSVVSGGLPPGLSVNPSDGTISGTPSAAGAFRFTVRLTDSASASAVKDYTLNVGVPAMPAADLVGIADAASPLQQSVFGLTLSSSYPVDVTGQVSMTFAPDADAASDDPAIQFSTGGRSLNFKIAAGSSDATFPAPSIALQTGSVSGVITLVATASAAGKDFGPIVTRQVRIARTVPVIRSAKLARTAGGFEVSITGYSPPRSLTQAIFRFTSPNTGALQTTEATVPLGSPSAQWFQSTASTPFGSQFTLTQPFQLTGDASAISGVTVMLENAQGRSDSVTVSF